jgi:hypothetical protein
MRTVVMFMLLIAVLVVVAMDDFRAHVSAAVNDGAATECAVRTGYKYNCADGSQSASCK